MPSPGYMLALTLIAQFIAVCSSSILAETLGISASFLSEFVQKRESHRGASLYIID